ncbi:MAG: 50S ribosomal protein L16 [Endomicrobia bacterium]|nr:50S ribosomal protein L16 [Endomicrobiia bacterium]
MLMPSRVKYRKHHLLKSKGISEGAKNINFGDYGLKTLETGYITQRQIESCRLTLSRFLKEGGKIWIRVFPDLSVTKKPAETRMGKGKGDPAYWCARVKKGRVLFELAGLSKTDALEALRQASFKLPVKTKIVMREHL